VLLLVQLALLLRTLVDFDDRWRDNTLRTVKLGIALLYRTVREAWTFRDKASADAFVNVHDRAGLRNLKGVEPSGVEGGGWTGSRRSSGQGTLSASNAEGE
jgi:hypothetical protein